MPPGRSLRLLILALAVFLGLAEGVDHSPPAGQPQTVSTISAPRESLPAPVHDEATCAFCQAATFPPCTPQPTDISVAERGEVRRERPAPSTRAPRTTADRPPSSRAPPPLRFV
jgi:hypothetical protein